jgi:hypothetical protein
VKIKIIGFCGRARAGKTYTSKMVVKAYQKLGIPTTLLSLASPIKEVNPIGLDMQKEQFRNVYITYANYFKALHGDAIFAEVKIVFEIMDVLFSDHQNP